MLRPSVMREMTAPYTAVESWIYDRVVADAIVDLKDALWHRLAEGMPEGSRVLDVGCGGGQLALTIASENPGSHVTGLDLSPEQVARARRRLETWAGREGTPSPSLSDRVTFLEGSALELPFDDASFDVVLSIASIKHWPDPGRGLSECVRVLGSGGRLVVLEADRGCRYEDAERFVSRFRLPRALRPLAFMAFRTHVAGRSIDLDEARELARELPLEEGAVERAPGVPALLITGRKSR